MELGLIRILVQRVMGKGHVRTMGCPNNSNSEQDGIRNPMYISKHQGLQVKESSWRLRMEVRYISLRS